MKNSTNNNKTIEQLNNKLIKLAFFGTPDYSLIVLESLFAAGFPIVCVVTKPPRPIGRKQILTPTPVSVWAEKNKIPVLTPQSYPNKPWLFASEDETTKQVFKFQPELLVSADYTQKIPMSLVKQVKYGGINIHPSLLPAYRGPAPIPWAIANGEKETGVSLVTLTEKFDEGIIIAQEKEQILPTDTTDSLLTKLFTKGGELLIKTISKYIQNPTANYELPTANSPSYFPRLTRDTGFEPWENIKEAITTGKEAIRIERKWRAFLPWPGLWTKIKWAVQSSKFEEKRLKILKLHLTMNYELRTMNLVLDELQLEGKQPVSGNHLTELLSHLNFNP